MAEGVTETNIHSVRGCGHGETRTGIAGAEVCWRTWWGKAREKQGGIRGAFWASPAQTAVGQLRPSATLCWLLLPVHGHGPAPVSRTYLDTCTQALSKSKSLYRQQSHVASSSTRPSCCWHGGCQPLGTGLGDPILPQKI